MSHLTVERRSVTYEQVHKYERGINRIAAGRLYNVALALGVDVGYFFEGLRSGDIGFKAIPQQRMLLELARNFVTIQDRNRQEEVCALARALAQRDHGVEEGANPQAVGIAAPLKFLMKLREVWAIDEQQVARLFGFEDEKALSELASGTAALSTRDMKTECVISCECERRCILYFGTPMLNGNGCGSHDPS